MKRLALAAFLLFCLAGISSGQGRECSKCDNYDGETRSQSSNSQRQEVAMARVPQLAWEAYKAYNSPLGRAARIAMQHNREIMKEAIEPERRDDGVNRGGKSFKGDFPGVTVIERNDPSSSGRDSGLTAPKWDRSFMDPNLNGGSVERFSREQRQPRETFQREQREQREREREQREQERRDSRP